MKKIRWFWDRGDQLYRKTVRITCITFVKEVMLHPAFVFLSVYLSATLRTNY